jgi:hypothetical protein
MPLILLWFEADLNFFAPFLLLLSLFGMGRFGVPRSPATAGRGMFCLSAVLRSDRKEDYIFLIRSLTP